MVENSINEPEMPGVLGELERLLQGARRIFSQERVFLRAQALFVAELLTLGRHTVTQLLRTLGLVDQDWSAWYRLWEEARFDAHAASSYVLEATLANAPSSEPYVTTVDGVILYRTGTHVAGSSLWRGQDTVAYRPGLQRGQRFVEVAWLTPDEGSFCRAIPLRWLPAVTAKAVPSTAVPCKEWEAGLEALSWVRGMLDAHGRAAQTLVGVMDGSYDVQDLWRHAPERTVLLVRTLSNRCLYSMPTPLEGPRGRGRPASYGERLPKPSSYLQSRTAAHWKEVDLPVRGRQRHLKYRVIGPALLDTLPDRPVFLIVVRGQEYRVGKRKRRKRYRKPAYYLVSAVQREGAWVLPFPVATLLLWAWQRWECEVAHREMKSALGIGEKQCWSAEAGLLVVQWGVWVYSLCVLAAYRAWGLTRGPRRRGGWYRSARRWSFTAMWQAYREALWGVGEFRPLYTPTLARWLKIDAWLGGLGNALADVGRI